MYIFECRAVIDSDLYTIYSIHNNLARGRVQHTRVNTDTRTQPKNTHARQLNVDDMRTPERPSGATEANEQIVGKITFAAHLMGG